MDSSCIDCDQCRTQAPELFARNADNGTSMVIRQPVPPEEIAQMEQIANDCATGSIGSDGV